MKHFKVQIIGGIVLHQGRISEMKTGEGKTLVSTLPAYLNALVGKGVHIVTVNDYLAKRDSEWMGKVHKFLGLKVGLVLHDMENDERRDAYNADITYITNNELGFDYLRDNMVIYASQKVQREHSYAIVDEVDSILIDEARTPLIISGAGAKSTQLYEVVDKFARGLKMFKIKESDDKSHSSDDIDADYIVDEKAKTATLTSSGVKKAEKAFNIENLTDPDNMLLHHHINQAIKAHGTMYRDQNYVVKDGQVLINLWHGSMGLKRINPEDDSSAQRRKAGKLASKTTDYCVTNSKFEEDVFKSTYWPNTEFLKLGHPRNDIMFSSNEQFDKLRKEVCKKIG